VPFAAIDTAAAVPALQYVGASRARLVLHVMQR
jgi:hypothetical protein